MARNRRPSRKAKRRERRAATRHGMTIETYRHHLAYATSGARRREAWKANRNADNETHR